MLNHALTLSAKRNQPKASSIRDFSSQRNAISAIHLGPARVSGDSRLKVPPEAQIRLPVRKCLSAYLYDFPSQRYGAAYRIRTCDPIITN